MMKQNEVEKAVSLESIRERIVPGVRIRTKSGSVLKVLGADDEWTQYEGHGSDYTPGVVSRLASGAWSFVEEEDGEGLPFLLDGLFDAALELTGPDGDGHYRIEVSDEGESAQIFISREDLLKLRAALDRVGGEGA